MSDPQYPPHKTVPAQTWHCGTLTYTKVGLVTLFVFLLWGDFCYVLMQTVMPSILPLKLKGLGASNLLIGILMTSSFPVMGMFLSPILSFKSDYLRTRWGRRIPFFILSLPLVCISILLLAFMDEISAGIHGLAWFSHLSSATMAIAVTGVLIVFFQFADVLIASVFAYIFNDTVPVAIIGRFVGFMKIVGGVAGFLYNYYIFKYAESHMKEIFIGMAILYGLGIGAICLFVKEGEYPPVTKEERAKTKGLLGIKTFFAESFCHRFYWTKFICAAIPALAVSAMSPFNIFFYKEMGMTLDYLGKAFALVSAAGVASAYFASVFLDRWHPLRILTYSSIFVVIFTASNWVWLFVTLAPISFFWLHMLGAGIIGAFYNALSLLAAYPCDMRTMPKSRFGQFSSAQSILGNACRAAGGVAIGLFFDFLKWIFHGSDYAYRFNFAWITVGQLIAAAVIISLYRQWQDLGGDRHFHPPAPWSPTGFEELESAPFVGTQTRWLKISLGVTRALMLLSILYLLPLTYWLYHIDWMLDFEWHLMVILPLSAALYLAWVKVERSIKADVARVIAGQPPRSGIPHHGVFFVEACALLLLLGVWIGKTIMAVHDGMPGGVMVFGVGNLITNALVIVAVLVMRRMERGYDPMLDYDGRKAEEPATRPPVAAAN